MISCPALCGNTASTSRPANYTPLLTENQDPFYQEKVEVLAESSDGSSENNCTIDVGATADVAVAHRQADTLTGFM
jgi:hypothetical protein